MNELSGWNSLEIAKLIISALTPLILGFLGLWFNRRLKKLEHLQWTSQKVIEKRLKVYEELVPHLNSMMCFFTYIGEWKAFTPPEVIQLKRNADKIAHINAPLFPSDFLNNYYSFIEICYEMYGKFGQDARLRTDIEKRRPLVEGWSPEWDALFTETDQINNKGDVVKRYNALIHYMADTLDLGLARREDQVNR